MATKTEMISSILDITNEYSIESLNGLNFNKVKILLNKLIDEEENKTLLGSEDEKIKNIGAEVVWNYDDLSPVDQKLYKRTGIKKKVK